MIKLPDDVVYALVRLKSTLAQCDRLNYCSGALHELEQAIRLNATAQPVSDDILKIADGLESLMWPNMGDGNRALIQAAIEVLRTLPVEYHVAYGFTLMPKEITLEMAEAAAPYHADCKQYYRALVAAAPGGQDD
ncbi:hypothetical protein [Pantoea stewartii]|uniref:hypothetical protein n=1 Tax=Pantoea stewartii TaxID=66269 RepID=UPI00259FFCA5|nr:hypothetical protein [Pantoea stewartii]